MTRKTFVTVCLLAALTVASGSACAEGLQDTGLGAFLDQAVTAGMDKYHIPNATVSIVKDGEIVYKKGFGLADTHNSVPVDPDTTLFRVGSTSKLVTWTAVMQLVERGILDLDSDVNAYLDFEIPPRLTEPLREAEPRPITLTHLMTHTAGFEDYPNAIFRVSQDDLLPLEDYVKDCLPARIFPAGEVAAYSNYSTALAGYIVERASGLPFAEYVEKNIFETLAMGHSTFRQPLDADLRSHLARPCRFVNGTYLEGGFEYILPEPAGSMSTTSSDMAKFMIAHLGGSSGGRQILKEETLARMHEQHYAQHPALGGMTLGFMEGAFNDKRVLFHGGGTMLYSTGLYLLPEEKVGIFISYSGGDHLLHSEVFQGLMDHWFPVDTADPAVPPEGSKMRARKFAGEYQMNRRSVTTDEKINSVLGGGVINVGVDSDGYLLVTNTGETDRFVEVEPGVYQNLRVGRTQDYFGPFRKIVFQTDPYGRTMLAADGPMTYSKAPFYATRGFTALAFLTILLTVAGSLLYWIAVTALGWFRRRGLASRWSSLARWNAIIVGVAVLALFAGILSSGSIDPVYQLPADAYMPSERCALSEFMPTLVAIVSAPLPVFTVAAWRKGLWKRFTRVHYTVYTLAVSGLMWMFYYWRLF